MILYTPLAMEDVLFDQTQVAAERICINYEGRSFYVDKFPNGEHIIVQMVSTNPLDYLEENFQPGRTFT